MACGALVTDRIEAKRLVPSDRSWRLRNYYMLVEKQRRLLPPDESVSAVPDDEADEATTERWSSTSWDKNGEQAQQQLAAPAPSPAASPAPELRLGCGERDQVSAEEQFHDLSNLVKAGCLLARIPVPVVFQHEEEQRVVLALAYDAFRYRSVFNQALQDTNFFTTYQQFREEKMLVHLLLCQLYRRRFGSRIPPWPAGAGALQALWFATGMARVEDALWQVRVRLAAALARLRIKSNTLRLEQLLPKPLRHQAGEDAKGDSAAWVNIFKIRVSDVTRLLGTAGLVETQDQNEPLGLRNFRLDSQCPGLVIYNAALRADLAQSQLVRDGLVVLQGRAFCLGPSAFCRMLEELALRGSVVQSHSSSPRTTAYLASLLASAAEPHPLITFGVGDRKAELEAYLAYLGATNVTVRAERFSDLGPDSALLEGVVAVLALPPNTFSAVSDPVELACSSGGDLRVLEEFALAAEGEAAGNSRLESLHREQSSTLRLALAAPQIQLVLFESHSNVASETRELLLDEVAAANEAARNRALVYARAPALGVIEGVDVEPPLSADREETVIAEEPVVMAEMLLPEPPATPSSSSVISYQVPATDLFEIAPLKPRPAPHQTEEVEEDTEEEEGEEDPCPALEEDGCFLALLRRQEITRLDAQYMIQIAESRGLFGGGNKKKAASASSKRTPRRKAPDLKQLLNQGKQRMMREKTNEERGSEIDRISAPTVASLLRQSVHSLTSEDSNNPASCADSCPRHARAIEPPPDLCSRYYFARRQDARRWWSEAAQRVLAMARVPNPALLPRFRLVRTPLPGPGATNREPYPLRVRRLDFPHNPQDIENMCTDAADEPMLSDHEEILCSIRLREDRDSTARSLVSFVSKSNRYL